VNASPWLTTEEAADRIRLKTRASLRRYLKRHPRIRLAKRERTLLVHQRDLDESLDAVNGHGRGART
jgi:hypothetical protein